MDDQRSEYQKILEDLSEVEFESFLESLSEEETLSFYYDLEWQGRPKQQLPPGIWSNWLITSGRGFGKTWVGAKAINYWARYVENIAIIGDNIGEVRDVMIDGPSGILKMARPDFNPRTGYNKTTSTIVYPNGCKVQGYSGQDPESLRGPNNGKAWVDELFKMRYQQEVWDELQMTMRVGDNPQVIITSTPRPTKLCRRLATDKYTAKTGGSTKENYTLTPKFISETIAQYEGTRRGRQEIDGEILDDNPGAMWKIEDIESQRIKTIDKDGKRWMDQMDRIVVAIDPATTSNEETSDATGLIVAGRKGDQGYVFSDDTFIGSPKQWSEKAVELYRTFKADKIVAEVNQGGDMVESIIRNTDKFVPYNKVHATRGKAIRAEPIAALYEQRRIHHVGQFNELEDEMLTFDPALGRDQKSPNRMDALVWCFTELFGESCQTPQFVVL